MTSPVCGAEAPDGPRFCPSCGGDPGLRGDQRRVVTVLFADLVGYTALSERRDPEQVKHLVDRCFERLVADIEVFGGRVEAQPHPQDASQVGRRACVSLTGLADVDGA